MLVFTTRFFFCLRATTVTATTSGMLPWSSRKNVICPALFAVMWVRKSPMNKDEGRKRSSARDSWWYQANGTGDRRGPDFGGLSGRTTSFVLVATMGVDLPAQKRRRQKPSSSAAYLLRSTGTLPPPFWGGPCAARRHYLFRPAQ